MGQIKWYKRDPSAALNGMMELTLEERGAYNTVLDLIYSRDGNLVDDDRFIAGWLRVDARVWKRIKATLMQRGKLFVEGGLLRNERADAEVLSALGRVASAKDAGLASARSKASKYPPRSNKNSDLDPTGVGTDVSTPVPTNHNHNQNTVEPKGSPDAEASQTLPPIDPVEPDPPAPAQTAFDLTKGVFDTGLRILRSADLPDGRARSMLGKWRKQFTDGVVLGVLARFEREPSPPSNPIEWITASLQADARKVASNGSARPGNYDGGFNRDRRDGFERALDDELNLPGR